MASNRRRPPRRGPASGNVLVTGDVGTTAGPQGGAGPGAAESGDLQSREFGVPQADIPGGLRHKVNAETRPKVPAVKPERPADYHKYHGVPSDDGQYADTPGVEDDPSKAPKPEPVPKIADAVPVYIVEEGSGPKMIRAFFADGPLTIPVTFPTSATGVEPIRLLDQDPNRSKIYITNEASSGKVRIGSFADVQDGRGLVVLNTNELTIRCQNDLWVCNTGGAAATISIGWETEVPAAGS